MTQNPWIKIVSLSAMLTACAATEPLPLSTAARRDEAKGKQQQLNFQLASGIYRCELGQNIEIQRDLRNEDQIALRWQGNRHTLQRYDSTSGLPRYEDRKNGLLWIDLPWKSVLIDVNNGRSLASECKADKG